MAKFKIKSRKYEELSVTLCDVCYTGSLLEYDADVLVNYAVGDCDICSGKTCPTEAH